MNVKNEMSIDIKIPFPSERCAEIAYRSLNVDQEPKRGGVKRTLVFAENMLHVHFEASEARKLRVSVNSFMDHVILVTNTMDQFGPPP
ncbi:uncharacterized protein LOC121381028 [Gigantopelta aegis]|uniref:uncharacterized protein LOC121381028 n=1 Tax=Gigantopelta aegis TaxID=1735272 RepID=UPI001B88E2F2|nr:uncharacterized protein LOC121381028 [Gigantopelta aegis]